ncbi:hypothetical protein [Mycobacterium sp. IDR2000157661]|uniref:hypothetical protein n=1 Tax=Mycobacterium sp. IDR2000157661 TaxID=2867005 RepID=UPI001EE9EF85|nr:hypothetical protein [Mycobacterium sp. IDR2000157661]ULE33578.1 hypothetical protein K3G64_02365 [Mycobacterium sp. IDR2000157661]
MSIRGPLVTLGAVGALAVGLWLGTVSQDNAPPPAPTAEAAASPSIPAPPAATDAPAFPRRADYIAKIPTATGVLTLDVNVDGQEATAYACDGNSVEVWLRGPAVDGAANLVSKDSSGVLDGHVDGEALAGTLTIDERTWVFTAERAQAPAGIYVYEGSGVRSSWIVDEAGDVTGVLGRNDGSIRPAPVLQTDGTAVIDGRRVTAVRVGGGSDV